MSTDNVHLQSGFYPKEVFKYTDVHGARCILDGLSVKATPPNQFNDPFEFLPAGYSGLTHSIIAEKLEEKRGQLMRLYYIELLNNRFRGNYREFERWMLDHGGREIITSAIHSQLSSRDFSEFVDLASSIFGVICLSEDSDNILMWSHYAQYHQGVVIGFDPCQLNSMTGYEIHKVRYSDKRPLMTFQGNGVPAHEDIVGIIASKAKLWSYENEWRILAPLNELKYLPDTDIYSLPVGGSCITRVILGSRISVEDKCLFQKNYSDRFSIKLAQLDPKHYRVLIR